MKIISLFNNKGGVGKSTLAFHLSNILAEMGHKTLIIDLDPQCNATICGMNEEDLHNIWTEEDDFIEEFDSSVKKNATTRLCCSFEKTENNSFSVKTNGRRPR